MKRLFVFDPNNDRRESVLAFACDYARKAGRKVHITIAEPVKSREQEQHYHAQIGDIAAQCRVYGKKLPPDSWKRLLIDAFKHDTKSDPDLAEHWRAFGSIELIPALNNPGFVMVGDQSRRFGVKLASAFIEWLYAYGAENDVTWSEPKNNSAQRAA